jgi:hypothetical protein
MVNHGLRPTAYKEKFRTLAKYIHTLTNLTAMVWGPNIGGGVVNDNSQSSEFARNYPTTGTPDFIEIDTNKDGRITNADDPYTPYYPGDEYVDW